MIELRGRLTARLEYVFNRDQWPHSELLSKFSGMILFG